MNKQSIKVFLFFGIFALTLCGCRRNQEEEEHGGGQDDDPPVEIYVIDFYNDDDTLLRSYTVDEGTILILDDLNPEAKIKPNDCFNYVFDGWSKKTPLSPSDPRMFERTYVGPLTTLTVKENASYIAEFKQEPKLDKGYTGVLASPCNAEEKAEVVGKLEEYAHESFLGGIPLFENRYRKIYSNRVTLPTSNSITGFGVPVISDGSLKSGEDVYRIPYPSYINKLNPYYRMYKDEKELDELFTATYWTKTLVNRNTSYEYTPMLAKDGYNMPVHLGDSDQSGSYTTWRVYVKTGAEDGIAYKCNSNNSSIQNEFNNRLVDLKDYEFVFQLLFTRACSPFAADDTFGLLSSLKIKGLEDYRQQTKNDCVFNNDLWEAMKYNNQLGIKTGSNEVGSFIEFEFEKPVDSFTAKLFLSNNYFSPLPQDYLMAIGGDYIKGLDKYGKSSSQYGGFVDVLSLGRFTLKTITSGSVVEFERNDDWFECQQPNKFNIQKIQYRYLETSSNPDRLLNYYLNDEIDEVTIDFRNYRNYIDRSSSIQGQIIIFSGDNVTRLNVNSCTQERRDYLFPRQEYTPYSCKPWMSNYNFLNGLFWSIDRSELAYDIGTKASVNFFHDSYVIDLEHGTSYNSTQAHQNAINDYSANNGYSLAESRYYFKKAITELVNDRVITPGSKERPTYLEVNVYYPYATDEYLIGEKIKNYFETAFNYSGLFDGKILLKISNNYYAGGPEDMYGKICKNGVFDLCFCDYNPEHFNPMDKLEELVDSDPTGYTLNWGEATNSISSSHAISYNGNLYSYESLLYSLTGPVVVKQGVKYDITRYPYMTGFTTNNLYEGGTLDISYTFDMADNINFKVTCIKVAALKSEYFEIMRDDNGLTNNNGLYHVTISPDLGAEINQAIVYNNNLVEMYEKTGDVEYMQPFKLDNYMYYSSYRHYWYFMVDYQYECNSQIVKGSTYVYFNIEERPVY